MMNEDKIFTMICDSNEKKGITEVKSKELFNEIKKYCRKGYVTDYSCEMRRMFFVEHALQRLGWLEEKETQPFDDGLYALLTDVKFQLVELDDYDGKGAKPVITDMVCKWKALTEYDIHNVSEYFVSGEYKQSLFKNDVMETAKENGLMTCETILLVLENYIISNRDPKVPF